MHSAGVQTVVFSQRLQHTTICRDRARESSASQYQHPRVVQGGDRLLIAGFVIGGSSPVGKTVVIRALGPSLATSGITDPLADPALEVRDSSGTLVASNNN